MKKYNILLALFIALTINTLRAETTTYYVNDLVGSPVAAMDQNGNVLWRESYNPYGESRIKPSQNNNDIGFTGHQKDDATGLTYMQARYYDPVVGRFYGVDPVKYTFKNPVMSFNRYLYANNNPYKYTDPDGKFIFTLIAVISVAYAAYEGYQAGGTSEALAEASGLNDAIDTYNNIKNGDIKGAVVSVALIACKVCKGAKKAKKAYKKYNKKTGSYINTHASGKTYSGKGSRARSQKSGRQKAKENNDPHVATEYQPAKSNREAFKKESENLDANGGPKSPTNYNKIESPGKKYRKQDGDG